MDKLRNWVESVLDGHYQYEVYSERKRRTSIETSDEKLENLSKSEEYGVGVRVFRGKKMGFAYTTRIDEGSIRDCVRSALQVCELTPEDEGFSIDSCQNLGEVGSYYDHSGLTTPLNEKIDLVIDLERRAKALDSRIRGVRKVNLKETELEVYCFNSCGLNYSYRGTWYTSMMAVLAQEGQDSSIAYDFVGSRFLSELPLEQMVEDVVFKATATLNPSAFQTKKMPAVLFRDASAMILEAFSPIFLGDWLVKGKTFLKGMEGNKVFSSNLTLVDDGTLDRGFMSLPVDAEGHRSRKNVLVEHGVFKGFLHSTYTALKSGKEPTGNSLRESFKSLPASGFTNLYISPGELTLEDMLQEDEVFLITDLMGLHTVDPVSGEFSLGASGTIYRGGKKLKSVRGLVIGGNIRELWNQVRVGKDLKFSGNVGSPSLFVEQLTVGG